MTSSAPPRTRPSRLRAALALTAFLAISYAVAGLGSLATITHVEGWYAEATKVAWNPPSFVFGPVWTVLYALMSIAAWLVWLEHHTTPRDETRRALTVYVAQLVLNAVWTPVFFALYPAIGVSALWIAAAIIVALDVAVLLTMLAFWRVRRVAAVLLIPYWAWVLYATTLNLGIAALNP